MQLLMTPCATSIIPNSTNIKLRSFCGGHIAVIVNNGTDIQTMIDCNVSCLFTKRCCLSHRGDWMNTHEAIKEQLTAKLTYCIEHFWTKLSSYVCSTITF